MALYKLHNGIVFEKAIILLIYYILGMVNISTKVVLPIHQIFYILGTEGISIKVDSQIPPILCAPLMGSISIEDDLPTRQRSY